jgi:hypothetical protein
MMNRVQNIFRTGGALGLAILLGGGAALADPVTDVLREQAPLPEQTDALPDEVSIDPFGGISVGDQELVKFSGESGVELPLGGIIVSDDDLIQRRGGLSILGMGSHSDIKGLVKENVLGDGVASGNISISDAAISDFTGIYVGAFNTGHAVSMQVNLTINVKGY